MSQRSKGGRTLPFRPALHSRDQPYSLTEHDFPFSPLSFFRRQPIKTADSKYQGRSLWTGAFEVTNSAFFTASLEIVFKASVPCFLVSLRNGHLFSSIAYFAFPLDLLAEHGPPGNLTVVSTGDRLATLRLVRSGRKKLDHILDKDRVLCIEIWQRFGAGRVNSAGVSSRKPFEAWKRPASMSHVEARTR